MACLRLTVREGRAPYSLMPHAAVSGYWGSIYPSVQNLLLAARAMGLGASLITLPLWGVGRARKILGLPRSVTPCCVVALGGPGGGTGRRPGYRLSRWRTSTPMATASGYKPDPRRFAWTPYI